MNDMSELEESMRKLELYAERLEFAISGSDAGMWDWNIVTGEVYFSDVFCRMLGYEISEIAPHISSWEKLVHPDDLEPVMKVLNLHLEGKIPLYKTEHRVRTKNGEWKWILDSGKVTKKAVDGTPLRAVGTHIDISDRKETEEFLLIENELSIKLAASKSLDETLNICLESAINYSGMDCGGIYIEDESDGSFRLIRHKGLSEEFIRTVTHYTADSANSRIIREGKPLFSKHRDILQESPTFNVEVLKATCILPVVHLKQTVACMNIASRTLSEVPDLSRRILEKIALLIGYFIIQAKIEDQVRQNQQDLNTLFNTIDDFLFILDMEGKIIHINSTVKERLGYSDQELLNKSVLYVHPAERHREATLRIEAMLAGTERFCRVPLIKRNGIQIPVETKVKKGKWNGRDAIIGVSRDTSELQRYELQLRENAERLEMALLASDAGLWDWNLATNKLVLNKKWFLLRGFDEINQDFVFDDWKSLVHPDDVGKALKALEEHLGGRVDFYQAEYRSLNKSGDYIWILDTGKIMEYTSEGLPLRVVGTNIDITSKKKNELILQQNLSQQELLSDIAIEINSLDNLENKFNSILGKIGRHTEVSRVYIFEDTTGGLTTSNTYEWCDVNIPSRKNQQQLVRYSDIPSLRKLLIETGRVYSEHISLLPADLRATLEPQDIKSLVIYPLYVQEVFSGFIGFNDCINFKSWSKSELELLRTFTGIVSNVLERRFSERSLKESEEKYSNIVNNANDGIYLRNLDGTIIFANRKFAEIHEYPLEDIIGRKSWEFLHPLSQIKVKETQQREQAEGHLQVPGEEIGITKSGKSVYLDIRTAPLVIQGELTGIFGIIRNISDRKEYERQLTEERDRANSANQAKSEFLANMSHEIRTPMNAILGFSEVLYYKLESEQHRKLVASVISSGNLLMSLLNDILDLSKIEAGKLEISSQPVDLKSILQEIKLLFEEKAKQRNIILSIIPGSGFPEILMLDEIRIKQVVFNLVGNAIKFTHSGFVNVKVEFVAEDDTKGDLLIAVEDSGIGIPQSQQDLIFESFRQQSGQSNRKYEGAGLGLAISKKLVEKMNGTIRVKSDQGRGSVFSVSIPAVEFIINRSLEIEAEGETRNITFNRANVMVVDDVPTNIEIVESILTQAGLNVTAVDSGEDALEMLKHSKPDLILLDLRMKGIDGYDVAKRIKVSQSLSAIPIIAYTASVFSKEKIESAGDFARIIFKPVSKRVLLSTIAEFLPHKVEINKVTENKTETLEFESLPEKVKAALPAIKSALESKALPVWNSMNNQLVLFRIEEFALVLKNIATEYEFTYLHGYSDKLISEIENLELDRLKVTINFFPSIIELVSLLIKNQINE